MTTANYEPGMKIVYDAPSKRVVVSFRGRITVLPEPCDTVAEATAAGERFCSLQGWSPHPSPSQGKGSMRTAWKGPRS